MITAGDYSAKNQIDKSIGITSQALVITKYALVSLLVVAIGIVIYVLYNKFAKRDDIKRRPKFPKRGDLARPSSSSSFSPTTNVSNNRLPAIPAINDDDDDDDRGAGVAQTLTKNDNVPLCTLNIDVSAAGIDPLAILAKIPIVVSCENAAKIVRLAVDDCCVNQNPADRVWQYKYPYYDGDNAPSFPAKRWNLLDVSVDSSDISDPKRPVVCCGNLTPPDGSKYLFAYVQCPDSGPDPIPKCGLIISFERQASFSIDGEKINIFGGIRGFGNSSSISSSGGIRKDNDYVQSMVLINDVDCRLRDKKTMSVGASTVVLFGVDKLKNVFDGVKKLLFNDETDCFRLLNGRRIGKGWVMDAKGERQTTKIPRPKTDVAVVVSMRIRIRTTRNVDENAIYNLSKIHDGFSKSSLNKFMTMMVDDKVRFVDGVDGREIIVDVFLIDNDTIRNNECQEKRWDASTLSFDGKKESVDFIRTLSIQDRNATTRSKRSLDVKIMEDGGFDSDSDSIYGATLFARKHTIEETSSVSTVRSDVEDNDEGIVVSDEDGDFDKHLEILQNS